ncbi:hypothetical protein Lal_00024561 [Lupinus albus]|nr:hypothetical protein Lal_00024561 [Lupinus albus]
MDERIDRKWMSVNRLTMEYEDKVKSFVKFPYENVEHSNRICEEDLAPDLGTVLMKTPTSQKEERKKTYQD